MKNFRERLAEWRDRHQLSRDKAGQLLGVTGHYIGMLERGDKEVTEESTIDRLLASYERDGLSTDNIIKEAPARYTAARRDHSFTDGYLAVSISRATHERLSSFSRERGIPSGDLADIAVRHYLDRLESHGTAKKR